MRNIFIVSGPAGSGKDSVISCLAEKIPLTRIVTATTRLKRAGEQEGLDYHFISRGAFESGIAENRFAEYSINENNEYYGVTREELERAAQSELPAIWKLDWKGVISAKKLFPSIPAIFVIAPMEVLEKRLRKRDGATKDEAYFKDRMAYTEEWLKHIDIYDYTITNGEGRLSEAVEAVATIISEKPEA